MEGIEGEVDMVEVVVVEVVREEIGGGRVDTTAPHTMMIKEEHLVVVVGLPWVGGEHQAVAQVVLKISFVTSLCSKWSSSQEGTQVQEQIQSHWPTHEELQEVEVAEVGPLANKGGTPEVPQGAALATRALQGAPLEEALGMPHPSMMSSELILVASSIFCTGI